MDFAAWVIIIMGVVVSSFVIGGFAMENRQERNVSKNKNLKE